MITLIQANGAALQTEMSLADFQSAVATASPSPWVQITEINLGAIYVNTFSLAYFYYTV